MTTSFKKLWKLPIGKDWHKADLRKVAGVFTCTVQIKVADAIADSPIESYRLHRRERHQEADLKSAIVADVERSPLPLGEASSFRT